MGDLLILIWSNVHFLIVVYKHKGVNTLKPRQNGRHFADDMFKCIFLNENVWIPIEISLKFVPKCSINNNPALFQIMVWRRQATSRYLNQWWLVHWRIYASLGLNELTDQAHSHSTKFIVCDEIASNHFIMVIGYANISTSLNINQTGALNIITPRFFSSRDSINNRDRF